MTKPYNIPFYRPFLTGNEGEYISQALSLPKLSGNGPATKWCQQWLESQLGVRKALLTQSCSSALEMTALLAGIQPGDEVILPSFTFVTTASAFVLRGAVPVFVDIRPDTLNLDETLVEAAITPETRAIVAVHYAGISCDLTALRTIADRHGLLLIEDAAQALLSTFEGRPLGSIGHMATLSFHDTKNIISGEGGTLLVNDPELVERAEIVWEKGTDRSRFIRGEVDKYTWIDLGSSYLPSEVTSAFLKAQLEQAPAIIQRRREVWDRYYAAFEDSEKSGLVSRPTIPSDCTPNGHIFYLLLRTPAIRNRVLQQLNQLGIGATFHYIPLHDSPAGRRYGRTSGTLAHTANIPARLLRLPLWLMPEADQAVVIDETRKAILGQ